MRGTSDALEDSEPPEVVQTSTAHSARSLASIRRSGTIHSSATPA